MKSLIFVLVNLALAASTVAGHGRIAVRTPIPAFIYLDGYYLSPAPRVITLVSEGWHDVTLVSMDTGERFTKDVFIAGSGALTLVIARFAVIPDRPYVAYFRPPDRLPVEGGKEPEPPPVKEPVVVPTPAPVEADVTAPPA